jgi:hypothetical protein
MSSMKGLVGGSLEAADAFIRGLLSAESFDRQALDGLHVRAHHTKPFSPRLVESADCFSFSPLPLPHLIFTNTPTRPPLSHARTRRQDFRFEPGRCTCRFPVLPHVQNRCAPQISKISSPQKHFFSRGSKHAHTCGCFPFPHPHTHTTARGGWLFSPPPRTPLHTAANAYVQYTRAPLRITPTR